MAASAFPLAKLGFLVIKQVSKPIAQGFARRAKESRLFREYICIPIAQFYHWYDVKVRLTAAVSSSIIGTVYWFFSILLSSGCGS